MALRALAFGDLPVGQARAYRQVSAAPPPGVESSPEFSTLPGEEAGAAAADTLALPSNEAIAHSPASLLALQGGTGATGGGTSGAVPIAPTDDPNAYLNKLAELPGFAQAPAPGEDGAQTPAPSSPVPPTLPSDTQTQQTEQARGLQRLAGGEATTTDESSPAGAAIESVRKGVSSAKDFAGLSKSLVDLMNSGTFPRSEAPFQAQRAGERDLNVAPAALDFASLTPSQMAALSAAVPGDEAFAGSLTSGNAADLARSLDAGPDVGGDLPGALGTAGEGLGAGLGGLGLLSGILNRNPFAAAMGGIQAGSGLSQLLGGPSLTSYLMSLLSSSGEAAGAAAGGTAAAGGAAAAGEAIPAGASGLVGLGLTPFAIALTNWLMGQGPPNGKAAETGQIRSDFATAYPRIKGAGETYGHFGDLADESPEQQDETLQGILAASRDQRSQIPALSQFTSTQGGRHSGSSGEMLASFMPSTGGVAPIDVSGLEKETPSLYMLATLNGLGAEDLLAQRGINPYEGGTNGNGYNYWDPGQTLQLLAQQGQVPVSPTGELPQPMTAEEQQQYESPGNRIQAINDYFARISPNYAGSPLAKAIAPFLAMPPTPSALANLAGVRGKIAAAYAADKPRLDAARQAPLNEDYWRSMQPQFAGA